MEKKDGVIFSDTSKYCYPRLAYTAISVKSRLHCPAVYSKVVWIIFILTDMSSKDSRYRKGKDRTKLILKINKSLASKINHK